MGDQAPSCVGLKKAKPFLAMVSLQFGYAGMYIITLVSLRHGMSHWVLAVYRHVVATLVMAPFAFFVERKIRPKMTLPIFLRIMVLGFLEPVFDQNLYYVGLKLTSATFASATVNMLPAVTFILALIFRLEMVNLKKLHSLAKVMGTVITVMGAMVMTLYNGPIIQFIKTGGLIHQDNTETSIANSSGHDHLIGILCLLGAIVGWSSFFILQSFTLKQYPAELSLTTLVCLMGTIQGTAVSLIFERDVSAWKLGFDNRLLAATYSGVVCSGLAYYVQGVVIRERGPVFVTSFSPLGMIITAAFGAILLAEAVHLGSILGAIFIVIGLYSVVWGKSKDLKTTGVESTLTEDGKIQELPITNGGGGRGGSEIIINGSGSIKILNIPTGNKY